jgi:hypothetical protein
MKKVLFDGVGELAAYAKRGMTFTLSGFNGIGFVKWISWWSHFKTTVPNVI